jgi:multisubunit Na+/H+ antiporter MnhF subunit
MIAAAATVILVLALAAWVIRICVGPTLHDRMLGVHGVALTAALLAAAIAALTERPDWIDAALAMVFAETRGHGAEAFPFAVAANGADQGGRAMNAISTVAIALNGARLLIGAALLAAGGFILLIAAMPAFRMSTRACMR